MELLPGPTQTAKTVTLSESVGERTSRKRQKTISHLIKILKVPISSVKINRFVLKMSPV